MFTKMTRSIVLGLVLLGALWLNSTPALAIRPIPENHPAFTAAAPAAASVTFNLCAAADTVTLPDGVTVDIWGYGILTGSACTVTLPGPELRVNAGDQVTLNLTNYLLTEPTSILIPGQTGVTASGGSSGFFTTEAAPNGGTVSYTFTAEAGTYLYESGTEVDRQVAMGLYGALVVEDGSSYDAEEVLVLSEIDPNLNADPLGFNLHDYAPIYWLINGKAYPDTDPLAVNAGDTLLVRYLNTGATHDTMALLGLHQRLIAKNGYPLASPLDVVAETIASGETGDVLITIPATATAGQQFPLYNRQFHLTTGADINNPAHFPGGMMTFIEVGAGAPSFLNFNDYPLSIYSGQVDVPVTTTVEDGGTTLHLVGNIWRAIAFPYEVVHNVNETTILEFDFKSTAEGEIHAIGFDTAASFDNTRTQQRVFQLYGNQAWGIQQFNNYPDGVAAGDWQHYKIPVGQFYTGLMSHLVFVLDHDVGSPTAESFFRNIQIYNEPPPTLLVNGNNYLIETYDSSQDGQPIVSIEDGGATLRITGNGWKKIAFPYPVTANTVLEFDFESSVQGEIHGIGFDVDDNATNAPIRTFQLYGTQTWGLQNYHNYAGETPKHYAIPVGSHYTGSMLYLVFAHDHDITSPTAESVFSNITVHE